MGVNIFWQLLRDAGKLLKDYDIEVIERITGTRRMHPAAPAKTILQILDKEVGFRKKIYGREGMMERADEIRCSCHTGRRYCR